MGKPRIVADLDPQDFAALRKRMARKWGYHRSIFKHAVGAGLGVVTGVPLDFVSPTGGRAR